MFPPIEPFKTGHLQVDNSHSIYWEASGNPSGKPAIFLHGGPGAGGLKGYRKMFDPEKYLILYLDQRGCGNSRPLAHESRDLSSNHTQALIGDIETLREHLGIKQWLVTGGSWGTTLAFAYAQAHTQRVTGLVLSSITTTSKEEVQWITEDVGALFPQQWDEFAAVVKDFKGERLVDRYYQAITSVDPGVRAMAAEAWCKWEDTHVSLDPNWKLSLSIADAGFKLLFATLVIHYWKHAGFLSDTPILDRMSILAKIPGVLLHGRYDVSSPLRTAWELHKRWPGSRLVVIESEGHGGPQMSEEMCRAISAFAECGHGSL